MQDSLEYRLDNIEEKEELSALQSFLLSVNEHFNIIDEVEFELAFCEGLKIYNDLANTLLVTMQTKSGAYYFRSKNYQKSGGRHHADNLHKNYLLVANIYNRYFADTGDESRLVVAKEEANQLKVTLGSNYQADTNWESDYKPIIQSTSEVYDQIRRYQGLGIFDLLNEADRRIGDKLTVQSHPLFLSHMLWNYKYLVIECCPKESSGYKEELIKFLKATNGKIQLTSYTENFLDEDVPLELDIEERIEISIGLNDDTITITELPIYLSLRLLKEVNIYLKEKHGTSFYQWHCENNPWEQATFIYLKVDTFRKYREQDNLADNITELEDKTIKFYEDTID